MAPRKEKSEKPSADQGPAMILEYLRKQNRPYSATDISSNLHNKVTKTAAAKYLKAMHERREVEERVSGKQSVYHIPQQHLSPEEPETVIDPVDLDNQITTLKLSITTLQTRDKAVKTELAQIPSLRTVEELQSTIAALQTQRSGLKERIAELKIVDVQPCSKQEVDEIDAQLAKWKKVHKERKAIVRNLWDVVDQAGLCSEGMKKEELWADLGCEGEMPSGR